MLPSRKHLAAGFNLLVLLVIMKNVGGSARNWNNDPLWRNMDEDSGPEALKQVEPSWKHYPQRDGPQVVSVPNGRHSRRAQSTIVFPDDDEDTRSHRSVPTCRGSTFCEDIAGYPTDLVNRVMNNDRSLQRFENVDGMDGISQRMSIATSESLCASRERVIFPKTAENMNNEWLFILNHRNFTQGVRIEVCVNQGKPCSSFGSLSVGYTTSCEQKYIYRQLSAMDSNGVVRRDMFRFPTSCCCHVSFTGI